MSYRAEMMQYYDEVLAQSARNYAFTLDKKWEQRYTEVEPLSDKLLKDTLKIAIKKADVTSKAFFSDMDAANQKLVKMERAAIDLVNDSKPDHAIDLLDSKEYRQQREILAGGLAKFVKEHRKKESNSSVMSKPVKEIIELERCLAVLEKQLEEEKFATIGHLASRMAHDMRNPLSVIQTSLENLKFQYGTDGSKEESFNKIQRAIFRITHQIDDVMDFVRKQPLVLNKTKMSDVIADALDSLYTPDGIILNLPKNDVELICDAKKLSVLMTNIILNGIQAMDGKGTIKIILKENNDDVIIEIEDSGSGIPQEHIEKIFEPLFTRKQTGTGLGLASVKSIVDTHGGEISVRNNPTVFTIKLPKSQNKEE